MIFLEKLGITSGMKIELKLLNIGSTNPTRDYTLPKDPNARPYPPCILGLLCCAVVMTHIGIV